MITKESAQAFAHHWIESWNTHDLEQILSHYSDDFEMSSPYIVSIMNEPNGTLSGKDKIGNYWSIALERFPDLKFELIAIFTSVQSVIIYYHSAHRGTNAAEYFLFNDQGKVIKSAGHYNSMF